VILIESVLGNQADAQWTTRLSGATVETLELDHWEAQKNRFRKKTSAGTVIAVSLDRGTFMRDGDILLWDEKGARAVIARISLRDVMVVHLDGLSGLAPAEVMRTCVELGHALGNQHWPALMKGDCVYVPLTIDRKVMESVMRTHRFEGIRCEFVPGGEIVPYLAPHESRRLFGGAEGPVHKHTHERYVEVDHATGAAYGRPPVAAHTHEVAHGDGSTQAHEHPHDHAHDPGHDHSHSHSHPHAKPGSHQ